MPGSLLRFITTMAFCAASATALAQTPITLSVDLNDAPRKILHATETLPVQPGPLTLVFPKWIPGEHMPSGPIDNQAGFFITGNGSPIGWERDNLDMFTYHLTVPQGVSTLVVKTDFLATASPSGFSAGASTSASLALLSWNSVLVYPLSSPTASAADILFTPSITIPAGWRFGTALEPTSTGASQTTTFKTISIEMLIDSPVLTGRYFREVPLAPEITPRHYLDMAGDGPEDIALSDEHIAQFSKLIRETGALYKSRHYTAYHFLVTLSDQVAHFGLEHHQSSDDRVAERTFVDDQAFFLNGLLLPHEFTHSWNGKYRRPAGLATANYQQPMIGDLLWVYEGLTEYFGDVLAARCGIWTPEQYRDRLATVAADLDHTPGRTWRDLQDTATMAQILYMTGGAYENWRRSTDFYDEGELVWLDVDTTIREKTSGKKSLNEFAAAFLGLGGNTPPKVVPYTFEDIVAGLNAVVPNDWATFLHTLLDTNRPGAPLNGIIQGGYKLTYTDTPNAWSAAAIAQDGTPSFWYSLGLRLTRDGAIQDVLIGSVADKAALGPGMQIIAVDGRAYTPSILRAAIKDAKGEGKPAIELIVENTNTYRVLKLDYHEGERFPQLVRTPGTPDRLDDILKPMTK
jgi:predicted metalloprotease with PDZ domain